MEQNTYRIPAHYATALINDDYSGLSDQDEIELNAWLKNVNPGHATCPDGEPFFAHGNDINNMGADCYDVVFIAPEPANYYIAKFQPIIDACKNKSDYESAYMRISSCIAGIISGRGFNQELDGYLEQYPIRLAFYRWWMGIKDNLHSKAF